MVTTRRIAFACVSTTRSVSPALASTCRKPPAPIRSLALATMALPEHATKTRGPALAGGSAHGPAARYCVCGTPLIVTETSLQCNPGVLAAMSYDLLPVGEPGTSAELLVTPKLLCGVPSCAPEPESHT